jgi:hypothetical protein
MALGSGAGMTGELGFGDRAQTHLVPQHRRSHTTIGKWHR